MSALFLQYGAVVVIVNVLLEQFGLPLPALPTLVVAGALDAHRGGPLATLWIGATIACLIPDLSWYLAGRSYGNRVMRLLCFISLNPDSCVNQTQLRFERWGVGALVFAKFVPGLAIIAPPLAGLTHMNPLRFAALSTLGSVLWVGIGLGAGVWLGPWLPVWMPHLRHIGAVLVTALVIVAIGYIAFKWIQRRRFFAALRMARIGVAELAALIDSGEAPIIVDVRSATARELEPKRIPGALLISLPDVELHLKDLSREREIVPYCSCPNEASAAHVAKVLMTHGFLRVRPLLGGLEAWIEAGYDIDTVPSGDAVVPVAPVASAALAARPVAAVSGTRVPPWQGCEPERDSKGAGA